MKVRVAYTVDVDDRIRLAIRSYYGISGMATRAEVVEFYKRNGGTLDNDILSDYDERLRREKEAQTKGSPAK
jgi:hypothetical protein